jgi:hypothetical protein
VTVVTTRGAIGAVAVLLVAGCAESAQADEGFTAADATRIANTRPLPNGWTWPHDPEPPSQSASTESADDDPLLAELQRQMADVVGIAEAGHKWRDDDKLGNLVAQVFGSGVDAHKALAALNGFSRGWGAKSGDITRDEEVDGLGDEAWRLWVGGNGTQVTYHWRQDNLLLEVHVHCWGVCPSDVDAATRAWVDAIDEAARPSS